MTLPINIKVRVLPRFPANVIGRTGIAVNKVNGIYYFDLNYPSVPIAPTVPTGTVPYTLMWDSVSGTYTLIPLSSFTYVEAPNDGGTYGRQSLTWVHVLNVAGGTMTGNLILNADPATALGAATKQYVDSHTSGIPSDAPSDGTAYGRLNAAWAQVLPLTGGTLTSSSIPLIINGTSGNGRIQFQLSGVTTGYLFSAAADSLNVLNAAGTSVARFSTIGTVANYVQTFAQPAGSPAIYAVAGSDTNIDLQLQAKGTGLVRASTPPSTDNSTAVATTAFVANVVGTPGTVPENSQSANYTTVLADAGKFIYHPATDNNARTFTIAANASVAYAIGTVISFVNMINTLTIAIATDTMTLAGPGTTGSRTLAANGVCTAMKIGTTAWIISGTGLT